MLKRLSASVCRHCLLLLLIQDPSGAARSLSRTEFIHLAWSLVGRGSKEEYGLLFESVVVTQEHRGLLLDIDAVKEEGRVDWGGLCSFLLLELSDKVKNTRSGSMPCWKPPRTLTCPHRDPVQKVKGSPTSWTLGEKKSLLWRSEHASHFKHLIYCSMLSEKHFDIDWLENPQLCWLGGIPHY